MVGADTENVSEESKPHIPVLLDQMLEALAPEDGKVYVDGTFGAGGYTKAILDSAECTVYAIDRDESVRAFADEMKATYKDRFHFIRGRFSNMDELLSDAGVDEVDGVVLDIGVSSMQLDDAERGFSFSKDAELDMRMGKSDGLTAKDFVNDTPEEEMANIIYNYGGERMSRKIARAIVISRASGPITHTKQLANIIQSAVKKYNDTIHPATRTFQAIRIWVNNELEEIAQGLSAAEKILENNGKLVVVSFHSLEDGIVKKFFQEASGKGGASVSRYVPLPIEENKRPITFKKPNKPIKPTKAQIEKNPRCRSAVLRSAIRTDVKLDLGEQPCT